MGPTEWDARPCGRCGNGGGGTDPFHVAVAALAIIGLVAGTVAVLSGAWQPSWVHGGGAPARVAATSAAQRPVERGQVETPRGLSGASRAGLDTAGACYLDGTPSSEGAVVKTSAGVILACVRETPPPQDGQGHPAPGDAAGRRLVWRER